ncbi:MAG: hypothetical protein VX086_01275 [Pseudomonadota bacterium]|nr:hypothetical protein [Pseudomonadota bacterium]
MKNMELISLYKKNFAIIFLTFIAPIVVQAKIKCWTNKEGIKECGDRIPPQYAQEASEEFSDGGILLKKNPKAKKIDQVNQDNKLANAQANKEKADQLLINMFSNVSEIYSARDKKIEQINQEIRLIETRMQKLIENKLKIESVIEKSNPDGKDRIARLKNDLISTEVQIEKSNQFILEKENELSLVLQKYKKDSERFIELQTNR